MTFLAGLVYGDARRPVEGPVLGSLWAGAPCGERQHRILSGGAALLAAGGAVCTDAPSYGAVVADVDVSNLAELQMEPEAGALARLLRRLWEGHGPAFAARLRGAFALALWIPEARRLVLAVDRFGMRRLYYGMTEHGVAFGSRVRGPLGLPDVSRELDRNSIYLYLNFGTIPAPQTVYRVVRRLPPGHVLIWENGCVRLERYWEMTYRESPQDLPSAAAAVVRHTEQAVRQCLRGADPKETGAFLSGGTDSSTVVGLMSRVTGERVNSFSIGFTEERYNELSFAELAARHFGASHHTQVVTAGDGLSSLPDVVEAYDEPFGNNSALPTYLCARLARQNGMRLLLAGDGGDEIFGGNERYRREYVLSRYQLIPQALRRSLIEPVLRAFPPGGRTPLGKAQRYVQRASQPNPNRFYASEFYVAQERTRLLHPDFLEAVDADLPFGIARAHYDAAPASSELNRLLYIDLKLTLGDNDLFKVVRAAALAGVGVRFPMLDHPLVEFTGTLPVSYKVRGGEKRFLFKRAFADLLPPQILAKVKHGFGLPASSWLKTHPGFRELARDTLLSRRFRERGYFQPNAVQELFHLHHTDQTPFYGDVLWTVLMLELWHRQHGDSA